MEPLQSNWVILIAISALIAPTQAADDLELSLAPFVKLAKTDSSGAVEKLRDTPDLDPDFFYLIFKDLDLPAHLKLLTEIIKAEDVANRFTFGSLTLMHDFPEFPEREDTGKKDIQTIADTFVLTRNEQVTSTLQSVPDDTPPVLLLPTLWQHCFAVNFLSNSLLPLADSTLSKAEAEAIFRQLEADIPKDQIPPRFHEIVDLLGDFFRRTVTGENPDRQVALYKISDLIEAAHLPVTVRLGYAEMGMFASESLPNELRIQIAQWLAEAWEIGATTDPNFERKVIKSLIAASELPLWKTTATRLIETMPDISDINDHTYSWMVGLAATSENNAAVDELLTRPPESPIFLGRDSMLPLLIRAGYHKQAVAEVSERKQQLLWDPFWDKHPVNDVSYDERLESQLPQFLKQIANAEVRYITELRIASLPDDQTMPPTVSREARVIEAARRFDQLQFKVTSSKLTALRLIGRFPRAAAPLSDSYVKFAQFDRVDHHLSNLFRADDWVELVDDTLRAVLAAKRFDEAHTLLKKMDASIAALQGDFYRSNHNQLWATVAHICSDQLSFSDGTSAEMLALARYVSGRPREYFPPKSNAHQATLIQKTISEHDLKKKTAEWWQWHRSLTKAQRNSHDTTLLRKLLKHNVVEIRPDSWQDKASLEIERDVENHLQLVGIFSKVPFDQPVEARVAAVIRECRPVVPEAIQVVYEFRYLSRGEILAHADRLAAALPFENKQKWRTLESLAESEGRSDLATNFRAKAN